VPSKLKGAARPLSGCNDRKSLAGMTHTLVETHLTAHAPIVFAPQAIITAGLVHINTLAFLRVQPIAAKARDNDIRLKDASFPAARLRPSRSA
jgi:hypothetical protein